RPRARRRSRPRHATGPAPGASVSSWGPEAPAWAQRPGSYSFVRCDHSLTHVREALVRRARYSLRGFAPLHAALDDLQRVDRMLVVVLGVLLEPPAAARPDLRVLREPAQRLLGDLLRHALHRVVRRRHRLAERRGAAHLGEVSVELLHFVDHGLRGLEARPRNLEAISHRAPHGVVPALDPDVVPEEHLAVFR